MKWKEYSDKALVLKQWIKKTELTSDVCSPSSFVITKNFILRFTRDKAVLCSARARHAFLEVSPLTKGHMERTPIVVSLATQIGKHSLNNHTLKSHRPNRNLGMALILTVNSNHTTLPGLVADSLHLSLWMLFSIHRITQSTMAGCLRFAIWLWVLFKAVLSKYQSGFPSGCLSVCLWII